MKYNFPLKGLSLLTFLNLWIFNSAASHQTAQTSGASISMPSYSDPVNFFIYLVLPATLVFFAIQQTIELKLEGRWRRDEPARKYSTIISGIIVAIAVISPLFHHLPEIETWLYTGFLAILLIIILSSSNWKTIKNKLPV